MEKIVNDCNDCPFRSLGGWEGELNECTLSGETIPTAKKLWGEVEKTPDWCKLKSNDVTIKLTPPTNNK